MPYVFVVSEEKKIHIYCVHTLHVDYNSSICKAVKMYKKKNQSKNIFKEGARRALGAPVLDPPLLVLYMYIKQVQFE